MSDRDSQLAKQREEETPKKQSDDGPPSPPDGYFAVSPKGTKIQIPKELFVAFQDLMKTRKVPGSISIQFRAGEIICVEALARKTYRGYHDHYPTTTYEANDYFGSYRDTTSKAPVELPSRLLKSEEFDITFGHSLSQAQIAAFLEALTEYCIACGGVRVEAQLEDPQV